MAEITPASQEVPKGGGKGASDFLATARARFKLADDAWGDNRKIQVEDLKFAAGSPDNGYQWPNKVKQSRENDPNGARPCLTINKLPQHIAQVTNEQRQNRPQIKVLPADDQADVEVAEVLDGVIRHIQYNSDADIAFDTACESQVTHGEGYFRILTDYLDETSFDQEILIKRIRNPFTVYMDPTIQDPSGADAQWCFITDVLSEDEFKQQFPKASPISWDQVSQGDAMQNWFLSDKSVRIAEYFSYKHETKTISLWANGSVSIEGAALPAGVVVGEKPLKTRKSQFRTVKWAKINGNEVLEEQEWAGKYIPVVRVVGNEYDIEGRLTVSGIVRNAKDAQRMYNYWASQETEMLALAPKAPFIGAAGQFEGFEDKWKTANTTNYAYLEYNPTDNAGSPVPPPERQMPPQVPVGIVNAKLGAADDIKSATGQYDPSLGNNPQAKSGVALRQEQRKSDVGTFHYIDNLSRALRHCGRILIDLIPKIYDTKRVARIIGEDGSTDQAMLDPDSPEAMVKQTDEMGAIQKIYNPSVGRYDVTVVVGPSYATKRQEAVEGMTQVLQANPALFGVIGDMVVRNMDWPGAEEMAERIKKTIPSQLTADEDEQEPMVNTPQGPVPASQASAMMAEMMQTGQQLTEQLQSAEMKGQEAKAAAEQARVLAEQNKSQELAIKAAEVSEQRLQEQFEAAKKELDANKRIAALELDNRDIQMQSDIRETMLKVEKMLSDHAHMVEELMEQPPEETTEPKPDVAQAILASTEQTALAIQQMMAALAAPRTTELVMDDMGNPTGSVSRLG